MAQHLVAINDFCVYHQVEYTFINDLMDAGLVEVTIVDKNPHIPEGEIQKLERMIRLHNELQINVPGIEAISHLLERVEQLQQDRQRLLNLLRNHDEF